MRGMQNIDKAYFLSSNYYEFPELSPITKPVNVEKWLSFQSKNNVENYADTGLHFYCEDFTFSVIWSQPGRYVNLFKHFGFIVQPDFSLYYNMPIALQIYNKYRNHWLARFYDFHGATVIPNVNPSALCCWQWSFLGFPRRSVVAFSDIGSFRDCKDRSVLFAGYEEMLKRLEPIQVIYFTRNRDNVPADCTPVVIDFKG